VSCGACWCCKRAAGLKLTRLVSDSCPTTAVVAPNTPTALHAEHRSTVDEHLFAKHFASPTGTLLTPQVAAEGPPHVCLTLSRGESGALACPEPDQLIAGPVTHPPLRTHAHTHTCTHAHTPPSVLTRVAVGVFASPHVRNPLLARVRGRRCRCRQLTIRVRALWTCAAPTHPHRSESCLRLRANPRASAARFG
jgi:hypothetical protein